MAQSFELREEAKLTRAALNRYAVDHWLAPELTAKQVNDLKAQLDPLVDYYQRPAFIKPDPILIPHQMSNRQDREIMGLFAALFAWGRRDITQNKCRELRDLLGGSPFAYLQETTEANDQRLPVFKHRTFNQTDLLYFLRWLRWFYKSHQSLEQAFVPDTQLGSPHIGSAISNFSNLFFSLPDAPKRTAKHISNPRSQSACKRICMFLRWMVRPTTSQVDFGIWDKIKLEQLICPLDVHVIMNARELGLMTIDHVDWAAAVKLTSNLRLLDANDPVKYDFALFGMTAEPDL